MEQSGTDLPWQSGEDTQHKATAKPRQQIQHRLKFGGEQPSTRPWIVRPRRSISDLCLNSGLHRALDQRFCSVLGRVPLIDGFHHGFFSQPGTGRQEMSREKCFMDRPIDIALDS